MQIEPSHWTFQQNIHNALSRLFGSFSTSQNQMAPGKFQKFSFHKTHFHDKEILVLPDAPSSRISGQLISSRSGILFLLVFVGVLKIICLLS